jgi:hypothetical protein
MTPPFFTPRRPLWQHLAIWVVAIVVSAGIIGSSLDRATTTPSGEVPAAQSQPTIPETTNDPLAEGDTESGTDSVVEEEPGHTDADSHVAPSEGTVVTAADQLATLIIKERAPRDGYSRDQFGRAWLDVDGNGCDTRNDILTRDLDDTVIDSRCRVLSGILREPFSGELISFERGETTSALVHIDHVVALSNAWQTGARNLTEAQRIAFANDPLNLLAVSGQLNQEKGDSDAASWLPPDRGYWCEYVARQVGVKAHYSLWVTPAEHRQMARVLGDCPDYPALTPGTHGVFRPGAIPRP